MTTIDSSASAFPVNSVFPHPPAPIPVAVPTPISKRGLPTPTGGSLAIWESIATVSQWLEQAIVLLDDAGVVQAVTNEFIRDFDLGWHQVFQGLPWCTFCDVISDGEIARWLSKLDLADVCKRPAMTIAGNIQMRTAPMPGGGFAIQARTLAAGADIFLPSGNGEHRGDSLTRTRDGLTGLLDRTAFVSRVGRLLDRARVSAEEIAVIYFDLDRFKVVNDTLGHPIGDKVLCLIADRIESLCRPTEGLARLGGDEFAIIQAGANQPEAATALAARVVEAVSREIYIDGYTIDVGASVGVAVSPFDGDTALELIRSADLAMYKAKHEGRGTVRFYEPEMNERIEQRRRLESLLRTSIDEGNFRLLYQPVEELQSKQIVAVEALVRWQHPEHGFISPANFIPVAEQTGLIIPLGKWVLRQACLDAVTWNNDARVAVNVSAVQMRNRCLVQDVMSILESTGLPANRLELEITETSLMEETQLAVAILTELRAQGVRIAMDDFGTGYSSINYLRLFPFDKIKIDRSFVTGIRQDTRSEALVKLIASLGASLEVSTTAEGVETDEELESVRAAGCTHIQGYLLSKPISNDALDLFWKNR